MIAETTSTHAEDVIVAEHATGESHGDEYSASLVEDHLAETGHSETSGATTHDAESADHATEGEHHEEGALHVSLKPEILFNVGPLPVTNSMLAAYSVSLFLIVLVVIVRMNLKTVPGKLQLAFESILMAGYNFVKNASNNNAGFIKLFFPAFMTLILFFWTANMANFIPGLLAISYNGVHLYRPALADYALVIGITLLMVLFTQITVVKMVGVKFYLKRYLNFSSPIAFFVGILEMVGEVARVLSLSFRLFGNIFAEEVLMLVILSLAPFLAPIPFVTLGLLTATIQALLFPMLTLLFANIAVEEGKHAAHEAALKAS